MATLTGGIGKGSKWLLDKIVGSLAATGVNPNFLTFLGLVVNFIAAATFAVGHFLTGALIIFFRGLPGHAGWTSGATPESRDRIRRLLRFHSGSLRRHGVVHGPARFLLRQRPHSLCS